MKRMKKVISVALSLMLMVTMVVPQATVVYAADNENEAAAEVATKFITVKYKTSTGVDKGQERVKVAKDAKEVAATSLKNIPEGYKVVGAVTINGRFASATVEPVEEAKPELTTKLITVKYQTSTGVDKGQEKIKVEKDAAIIPVTDLKNVPEGYKVVGVVEIDGRFAKAIVEPVEEAKPEATTKLITVNYQTSTGVDKGQEKIKVEKDAVLIPATDLKKVPKGYRVVGAVEIDGRFAKAIVEPVEEAKPEAPKSRLVRVEYVNAAGAIVEARRVNVEYGRLALTVSAPEGYRLFDTNNVISIDDETKTVKVLVVKEEAKPEAPKSRLIRVEYKTVSGRIVATERQNIEYGRLALTVKAPEGYRLFDTNNVISIDDETKTVEVLVVAIETAEPVDPENPVDPEDPVDPEGTVKPEDSAKPEDAVKPEDTVKPADTTKPAAPVTEEAAAKTEVPKTGDEANVILWVSVLAASAAGIALVANKKRKHTK